MSLRSQTRNVMGVVMLLGLLPCSAATKPTANAASELQTLATMGCERVPEASSPDAQQLQCKDDRSYFLCTQMQAQDARLNCAIDATASKVDWSRQPTADLIESAAFASAIESEPCLAWVYPDPNEISHRYGQRCATELLRELNCSVSGAPGSSTACPASAKAACVALRDGGYAAACTRAGKQ